MDKAAQRRRRRIERELIDKLLTGNRAAPIKVTQTCQLVQIIGRRRIGRSYEILLLGHDIYLFQSGRILYSPSSLSGRNHQIRPAIELMINGMDDFSNNISPLGTKPSRVEGEANLSGTVRDL